MEIISHKVDSESGFKSADKKLASYVVRSSNVNKLSVFNGRELWIWVYGPIYTGIPTLNVHKH